MEYNSSFYFTELVDNTKDRDEYLDTHHLKCNNFIPLT